MNITFAELRKIKHQLPTGGVKTIANKLNLDEQTVRNYFGAKKYDGGQIVGKHVQPGPNGGFVNIENPDIIATAKKLIAESKAAMFN